MLHEPTVITLKHICTECKPQCIGPTFRYALWIILFLSLFSFLNFFGIQITIQKLLMKVLDKE